MPLYEYQCSACGKVHEIIQKFADAALTECPDCQGEIKKLMSRSSFALKGTGWYTTDYKRSSAPAAASTESKVESKPETKSADASSPAPKTETKPTPKGDV